MSTIQDTTDTAAEPPAGPEEPAAPGLPVGAVRALAVGLAGLIAWSEVDRLIAGAVSKAGVSRSLSTLSSPAGFLHTDYWQSWAGHTTSSGGAIARWIVVAALVDVAFFVGYLLLLRGWIREDSPVARRWTGVLLSAEIAESALLIVAAAFLAGGGVPPPVSWAVAAATTVKWFAVAVVLIAVARNQAIRRRTGRWIVAAFRALRVQRLSLVIVVVLAVLSLIPSPNLFDQFPDVLRGWFDDTYRRAPWHYVFGLLAYVVGGVALFFLGRQRSERSWTTWADPINAPRQVPSAEAGWKWWLVGPAVALLTGLALTPAGLVDWRVVGVFAGVPVLLLLVSRWLSNREGAALWSEELSAEPDEAHARRVWVAGDLLAAAVPVLGALALLRALVAPVVLDVTAPDVHWLLRLLTLTAAVAVLLLWLPAANRLATAAQDGPAWLAGVLRPYETSASPLRRPLPAACWAAGIAFLVGLLLFPIQLGAFLGVVATAILALVAWSLVLGLLIVHLQYQRPLAVFRWLHMRATPVLTLFLVVPLLASLFWGGVRDLHALRTADAAAVPARPSIEEWFRDWQAASSACTAVVDGHEFQPLVLVAASGGGIRAAYWTEGIMTRLAREAGADCDGAVFLSSGVSGGSVGLAVARGTQPDGALNRLSRPESLSAALSGLLVGDLVAGSTGLRVPSASDGLDWRDRAGLMETVWEGDAPALADPFDAEPRGPGGMLVLNSTSTATGCRVLVSQLELAAGSGDGDCVREDDDLPAGIDLFSLYGACAPRMSWATAAMLSARFPTVTPAGRVPPDRPACAREPQLQLIDGGYAESSGLGTVAELAPAVLRQVVAYNAGRGNAPPVLPLVLYLEDETRTGLAREPGKLTPEAAVPLVGNRTATALQTSTTTWLQRAGLAYAAPCVAADDAEGAQPPQTPGETACLAAAAALHDDPDLSDGVFVAAPLTRPSVDAPLGWALSRDSRQRLTAALDQQVAGCTADVRPGQYACLEALLGLLPS